MVRRKKKNKKWLRAQIRKLLGFVKRDIRVIRAFLEEGYVLPEKYEAWWETIQKIYAQQQYMYDQRSHSVADRIVSFHQPWIHPIVRGKARASVEFGAKFDLSMDWTMDSLDWNRPVLMRTTNQKSLCRPFATIMIGMAIIRNECWQIRFIETERILFIVKPEGSGFQDQL